LARDSDDPCRDGFVVSFGSSPKFILPANEDAEKLRQKWAERRAEAERSRFWWDVQQEQQRILLEEQPDTFVQPIDFDNYFGPNG
jgi:hypothetical protein